MIKTTISAEGQVAIPRAVREKLNLKAGSEVSIDVKDETIVLKPVAADHPDWHSMRGMFRGAADLLRDLTNERAAEIARDNGSLEDR